MAQAQQAVPLSPDDDLLSPSDSAYTRGPERKGTVDSDLSQDKPTLPPKSSDPYAGLDNAFGGYVADQPKPGGSRPGEFDDLLL